MHRALRVLVPVLLVAACAGPQAAGGWPKSEVRKLGESFSTSTGEVNLIRVQDEYRLIRCTKSNAQGLIAGCYDVVFQLPRDLLTDDSSAADGIRWNTWVGVPQVQGLEIMFLAPDTIALREVPAGLPK